MTLNQLEVLLNEDIKHSRPTSDAQRFAALNYGRRRVIDLIRRTRPEWLLLEAPLTIPASQARVPLSVGFPRLRRVKHIASYGPGAGTLDGVIPLQSSRAVVFEYASVEGPAFRRASQLPDDDSGVIYYDVLFPLGAPVLAVAPRQRTDVGCIVSYYDEPERFTPAARGLPVSPVLEDREALIRAWAMEWLLRATNDAEASAWRDIAAALAAEATDDLETVDVTGAEAHDTGLYFGDV